MSTMNWNRISSVNLPPENKVVITKIADENNVPRNVQKLKLSKGLWWFPDGSMYVYYTPTHWREVIPGWDDGR